MSALGHFALSMLRTFQVVLLLGASVMLSWVTIRGRLSLGRRSAAKRTIASRSIQHQVNGPRMRWRSFCALNS